MTALVQAWTHRVLIDGDETSVPEIHASFGARSQTVGTCTLLIPLPLPGNVAIGATVVVEASLDGAWLSAPLFTGEVREIDDALTASGALATVSCEGPAYRLAYPVGSLAFAGGAKALPQTIASSAVHVGTQTIAHYADDVANGIEVDFTATPLVDSDFVWLAGLIHGSNSYDTSIGDRTIKAWSKVDVYQSGDKIGYANLPESNEQWSSALDYTNAANWDDLDVFVAAPIRVADGDVTFRFRSGRKPGSSSYDEYEIGGIGGTNLTWQTAGRQSIREIVRGLCKRVGLTTGQYDVYEVTDLDGDAVRLGGNGLVDAGQVLIDRREQPAAFVSRILDLFGFVLFDSPDGVVRVRPFRGNPTGTAVATFTEGTTIIGVPTATIDPRSVYNAVLVEGASGSDQNGKRFAYRYRTASPAPNAYIPDPPGERLLTLSSSLLVSDALCEQAGEIAEVNNGAAQTLSWDTWPHVLKPADVVQINAPTAGVAGKVFVDTVRYDIDASGYRMSCTGWDGVATEFAETPDPNPSEVDAEPVDPRPDNEWIPYSPLSSVS